MRRHDSEAQSMWKPATLNCSFEYFERVSRILFVFLIRDLMNRLHQQYQQARFPCLMKIVNNEIKTANAGNRGCRFQTIYLYLQIIYT